MSRTTFTQRFKTLVGLPPLDYLMRWRMTVARAELRKGDKSLRRLPRASATPLTPHLIPRSSGRSGKVLAAGAVETKEGAISRDGGASFRPARPSGRQQA
ncbi:hypothetical protein JTP94_07095 [Rhizobium lusitanum]|nr:hypothetical protein [Rhizobium lusitanum]